MSKKIGLYGGTFDPIHFGHLNLAVDIKERRGLDEVWLIPTGINPFKVGEVTASPKHRLRMTELAAAPFDDLHVLDVEIKREGTSYAIDTLLELIPKYLDHEFAIIIGEDAADGFFSWKNVHQVIDLVPIYVGRRQTGDLFETISGDRAVLNALREGMTPTRIIEISSTEIRDRIKKRFECSHLMPLDVIDYINKNLLYS